MAKNLSEEREALYQMICSLKSEDIQKVVSYVSFLRFVDVYKDKAMADLLKIELAQSDNTKGALSDASYDTVDTYLSPSLELPYEDSFAPHATEPKADIGFSAHTTPYQFKKDDEIFYAPTELDAGTPFAVKPLLEPQALDDLPSEALPHENFAPDESEFEPVQPVTIYKASPVADEPFPQNLSWQRLRWTVEILRLNFTDVAFLFHVSPLMVRMWFAGVPLGAEEEMQLQYILEVAERVREMDIPRLDQAIRHPMPDGEFFLEKLKDRKITDENLKTLQETAERSEELRRKFKGATKPFHTMQNAIGLYATPLHCEG